MVRIRARQREGPAWGTVRGRQPHQHMAGVPSGQHLTRIHWLMPHSYFPPVAEQPPMSLGARLRCDAMLAIRATLQVSCELVPTVYAVVA